MRLMDTAQPGRFGSLRVSFWRPRVPRAREAIEHTRWHGVRFSPRIS
jgi:hypothetical protein